MAEAPVHTDPPVFRPGLMLSHDWTQLHTPRTLVDVGINKVDSSDYQTLSFPVTNEFQFQAFVHGLGRCELDALKNCPLHLLPGYGSETSDDCANKPRSGMVKMVYKTTHTLQNTPGDCLLSDDVIQELRNIEKQALGDEVPTDGIVQFFKKFGSHFPQSVQRLGKCFSWMVVVDGNCNMDLLGEIAKELFEICAKYEANILGSHEGIWYSLHNVPNCTLWNEEKKKLLQSARLCVAQHGNSISKMSFTEWKQNDCFDMPVAVDTMIENIVSVWDLIEQSQMQFQVHTKLSSVMNQEWQKLAEETKHSGPASVQMNYINIPCVRWSNFLDDIGMKDYFPAKLTLQNARSLHILKEGPITKTDLPWRVLDKIMLLNAMCREEDICKLTEKTKGKKISFKDRMHGKKMKSRDNAEEIPHPMDVTLLIFLYSDFMLRQVLAKKLSMCRLAIPFIVPMPDDRVEILLWPLRSIVMEWCDKQEAKEEALVKNKVHMVAFMRYRQTKLSKSKLLNTILASSSHAYDVFCHKDTPYGNGKRQISNGTVEVASYLPSASEESRFSEPALFFNLRGDACDYPVQHSLMMELATVLVIIVDLQELQTETEQELLCDTVKTKHKVVVILTDNKGHPEDELFEHFKTLIGDAPNELEVIVTSEDGRDKNFSHVVQEVTQNIKDAMVLDPPHSLEDFVASTDKCPVDETIHQPCQAAKRVAEKILSGMHAIPITERKQHLLPQHGQSLREKGHLLKALHRSSDMETSLQEKEDIKKRLKDINESQASVCKENSFLRKVLSMFLEPIETKAFAMQWLQTALDAISRTELPELHRKWNKMIKAKEEEPDSAMAIEKEIASLEKQMDDATFGMEHIMREIAQLYDVASDLGKVAADSQYDLSSLPDIVAHILLEGHPMELMDGDHGFIPLSWVKAVFRSLATRVGEKKIFVLSVMGIQSSGKSTLLNTLFGLELAVSAGRCTKGIYAQLLPVTSEGGLPFDYMLVLDSEGLRAQELGQYSYEHDNELATLVIGLSDLALINVKGENLTEITNILQIVVLAFLRMKQADSTHRNQCMFIHQNVSAVNKERKLAVGRQKFQKQLDTMTVEASEIQGLYQTFTSFKQIMSFDGDQDMIYFSDLWHGDPPMAPVNRGYSRQAAETRQRILTEVSQNCKTSLTISEFVVRIEDMWKGVLTDDFVFNFRNSLAAKAYLDLEREFARLTMEMEEDLLQWVNTTCNIQMHYNCESEQDVGNKYTELKSFLCERVSNLKTKTQTKLDMFFERHSAKRIIMQWKEHKKISLEVFAEAVQKRMHTKLDNIKARKWIDIHQKQMSHSKEQAIMTRAIALAERLRGKCPKEALEKQFDEIWNPWAQELIAASFQQPLNVKEIVETELWAMLTREGCKLFLKSESASTHQASRAVHEEITQQELAAQYFRLKYFKQSNMDETEKTSLKDFEDLKVAAAANAIEAAVKKKVDSICKQDVKFDNYHIKEVFQFAVQEVEKYNSQNHVLFSFTLDFHTLLVQRAAFYAIQRFESMDQKFEERHGIQTKLKHLRQRVFKQFQNAVKDASTEVTISEELCETIREALITYVRLQIDQQVVKELHQELGISKYDLITKMLDDIITTRNFSSMQTYVNTPVACATQWIQNIGEKLVFGERDGKSRYTQIVHTCVGGIIAKVIACTQAATDSVAGLESAQYSKWISKFYYEMKDTVLLDLQQLEVTGTTVIKDFKHFQKCLERNLKKLEAIVKEELCAATAESVIWATEETPFQRVCERMWGCPEMCPFCKEPCQHSDPNHTTAHSCIQHRPLGLQGTKHRKNGVLITNTCNVDVTLKVRFTCAACSFKCRQTPHCTETDINETVSHPFREYKKFVTDWDIAPDQSGEATKFWKWIMFTFQGELVEKYRKTQDVVGLEIPESWGSITEQEARDSLRKFFQ